MTPSAPEEPNGDIRERVAAAFAEMTGHPPALWIRSPGRINLIGDHTDYNDGFVLPMAIDRNVWLAIEPTGDSRVSLRSIDFPESCDFDLGGELSRGEPSWVEYVKGVAWALGEAGYPRRGVRGVLASDVPIGAGLSSSAALELAVARALLNPSEAAPDATALATIAQRAEREWVGMACGIMDQLVCAAGRADHAILIDCRSLAIDPVPLPSDLAVVALDTASRRQLVASAYNTRRAQCEEAVRILAVPALRDVELAGLEAGQLEPEVLARARHVVSENNRVLAAAKALRAGDAAVLGRLMNESHTSLRDDYQVSSAQLDTMVELARQQPGCYGARLTGAGFGGCAVAVLEAARADSAAAAIIGAYREKTGLDGRAYVCRATDGAAASAP